MTRLILIDQHSGYIWGDTIDFRDRFEQTDRTPADAARLLDESLGVRGRVYEEGFPTQADGRGGYHVYRCDAAAESLVPTDYDGQDQEAIEAVEQHCEPVAFVAWADGDA